ncbi:hypothetical protein [Gryllotalpicola ginsengisoli]|uniref:hypothetical protein n=1 Tax=Gryllotalpicola ginsengisoli TaxID=444608 RepID=UPI0009D64696|nr:hypothetical protein [Gryllotalpicola ginsengisoli]
MSTTTARRTYTAKLTDGPLEGKTMRAAFLESGDPQPRISIPANDRGKRFVYSRSGAISEFDESDGAPSVVDYRYFGADFS